MTEELEVLETVTGRLEGAGIPYEVQLADVRNLLSSVPDLDTRYLERWTARLGLAALYREALGD